MEHVYTCHTCLTLICPPSPLLLMSSLCHPCDSHTITTYLALHSTAQNCTTLHSRQCRIITESLQLLLQSLSYIQTIENNLCAKFMYLISQYDSCSSLQVIFMRHAKSTGSSPSVLAE